MAKFGSGYSYETAIAKIGIKHRLKNEEIDELSAAVYARARKCKQLTRKQAREQLAEATR
jgi:hypothetical protein